MGNEGSNEYFHNSRLDVIHSSHQSTVAKDIKTPGRGFIVKMTSRINPEHCDVWEGETTENVVHGYRQSIHLATEPTSCIAKYIPRTRIRIADTDTIQIVQQEVVGKTLDNIARAIQSKDVHDCAILPKRIAEPLNTLFIDCLRFAVHSMSLDESKLPRAITFHGHPVMRQPKKGEAVMPEILAGNGMTNILYGTLVRHGGEDWHKPSLWIPDITGLALIDKSVSSYGIYQLLLDGLEKGGISSCNLNQEVQQICYELDKRIQ